MRERAAGEAVAATEEVAAALGLKRSAVMQTLTGGALVFEREGVTLALTISPQGASGPLIVGTPGPVLSSQLFEDFAQEFSRTPD